MPALTEIHTEAAAEPPLTFERALGLLAMQMREREFITPDVIKLCQNFPEQTGLQKALDTIIDYVNITVGENEAGILETIIKSLPCEHPLQTQMQKRWLAKLDDLKPEDALDLTMRAFLNAKYVEGYAAMEEAAVLACIKYAPHLEKIRPPERTERSKQRGLFEHDFFCDNESIDRMLKLMEILISADHNAASKLMHTIESCLLDTEDQAQQEYAQKVIVMLADKCPLTVLAHLRQEKEYSKKIYIKHPDFCEREITRLTHSLAQEQQSAYLTADEFAQILKKPAAPPHAQRNLLPRLE